METCPEIFEKEKILIEPALQIVGGKTPDFYLDILDPIAIEVFCAMDERNHIELEIFEFVNSLDTDLRFSFDKIFGLPEKGNLKIRDIKNYFKKLIVSKKDINSSENFHYSSIEGISLKGEIRKKLKDDDDPNIIVSTTRNYVPNLDLYEQKLRVKIRNRIKEKLSKYRNFKEENIPLIIIIYDRISHSFKNKEEWEQIINGLKSRFSNKKTNNVDRVFCAHKNRSLSLLLIEDQTRKNSFHYFLNSFAKTQIQEDILVKLKKTFIETPLN